MKSCKCKNFNQNWHSNQPRMARSLTEQRQRRRQQQKQQTISQSSDINPIQLSPPSSANKMRRHGFYAILLIACATIIISPQSLLAQSTKGGYNQAVKGAPTNSNSNNNDNDNNYVPPTQSNSYIQSPVTQLRKQQQQRAQTTSLPAATSGTTRRPQQQQQQLASPRNNYQQQQQREDVPEQVQMVQSDGGSGATTPDPLADSEPALYGSVAGQPGVDFPAYTRIPKTSFTCEGKGFDFGFYADEEAQCQVYHVCWSGRRESFLCGVGTVFNQAILACDYWHSVDCSKSSQFYGVNSELGKWP